MSVSGFAQQRPVFVLGSFQLVSWRKKRNWQWCRVSPGIFLTPVVNLIKVLHTWTTITFDATKSLVSLASLSETFVWSARSVRGVSANPELSGLVSEFEHLYVFTWSDSKLLHNYTGLNFLCNYLLVFVVKLVWYVVGGNEKYWSLKHYVNSEAKKW